MQSGEAGVMAEADVLRMLAAAPRTTEVVEALEAYVAAHMALDKAHDAWRIAEQRLKARGEALERATAAARKEASRA
jgi:hypothetical protein